MSRWIDAEKELKELKDMKVKGEVFTTAVNFAIKVIEEAPSIDLVRCAECIHKRLYDGETKYYYCALEDRPNRNWSVDDWNFCYWGERKDND